MAPIPRPKSSTVQAIYDWYKAANDNYDSLGISVGELGNDCDRALWYGFRWTSPPEDLDGRKIRLFRHGDIIEDRLVEDLRNIGIEVTGQQNRIRLVGNHVRGKIDGRGTGIKEAPKTEHLIEFKSSNRKNFLPLVKNGVQKEKPLHYVQLQLGMHMFGLTRGLYLVDCKDDDELYAERVEYDVEFCARTLARAERIILAEEPPAKISDDPEFFKCRFCKHQSACHAKAFARVTCRSCLHSTPEMNGDGHWSCARFNKPLGLDEQRAACPAHLFIPGLVPGEQTDIDEQAETVTYRLHDGRTWVDGAAQEEKVA